MIAVILVYTATTSSANTTKNSTIIFVHRRLFAVLSTSTQTLNPRITAYCTLWSEPSPVVLLSNPGFRREASSGPGAGAGARAGPGVAMAPRGPAISAEQVLHMVPKDSKTR